MESENKKVDVEVTFIGENDEYVDNADEAKWIMIREYENGKMVRETIGAVEK